MMVMRFYILLIATGAAAMMTACGPPRSVPADEVLAHVEAYAGKRVVMKTRFRSGARCRQESPEKKWRTYCKDCQFCRGPVVVDSQLTAERAAIDDWPMILGGTWKGRDIRCTGPLNAIECYPFVPGRLYVVQGKIEHQRPPKLLVEDFWDVDDSAPAPAPEPAPATAPAMPSAPSPAEAARPPAASRTASTAQPGAAPEGSIERK